VEGSEKTKVPTLVAKENRGEREAIEITQHSDRELHPRASVGLIP